MNPPLGMLDYPLIVFGSSIVSRTRGQLFYVNAGHPMLPEQVCALLNKAIASQAAVATHDYQPLTDDKLLGRPTHIGHLDDSELDLKDKIDPPPLSSYLTTTLK